MNEFCAKVLMESGDVYGVGENWYGQLGIGSKDDFFFGGVEDSGEFRCFIFFSKWHLSR